MGKESCASKREKSEHGVFAGRRRRGGAIHDLVHGIDAFAFAGTATQNKNSRDEMKMRVLRIVLPLTLAVFPQNDSRNAHRLATMAAQHATEMLR